MTFSYSTPSEVETFIIRWEYKLNTTSPILPAAVVLGAARPPNPRELVGWASNPDRVLDEAGAVVDDGTPPKENPVPVFVVCVPPPRLSPGAEVVAGVPPKLKPPKYQVKK